MSRPHWGSGRGDCVSHAFGDILAREGRIPTFRVQCSCGWSSPWWGSIMALVSDVHAHRHGRRRARRLGTACRR